MIDQGDLAEQANDELGSGGSEAELTPPAAIPPFVAQLVANQRKELEVRAQEADIERRRVENERYQIEKAHEYAMRALDVQVKDRAEERKFDGTITTKAFRALTIVALGVIAFFLYALYDDRDQLILEILRVVVYAGGGGGIGYAIGQRRNNSGAAAAREEGGG